MSRGRMLRLSGGTLTALLLAGCGPGSSGGGEAGETTATRAQGGGQTTTGQHVQGTRGVVFNTASRDVTLFDPATNKVTGSWPTNAVVRWLSNEQHYWDGESVWTYDYPDKELQAIALNPQTFEVGKRVPVGKGPGHSFVLAPDNKRGYVNCAEADFVAVVDPVAGEVVERMQTGAYP
jgi:DNA-binding beta-propeller fold protein YncE